MKMIFKVSGLVRRASCGDSGIFQEMMRDAEELPVIITKQKIIDNIDRKDFLKCI